MEHAYDLPALDCRVVYENAAANFFGAISIKAAVDSRLVDGDGLVCCQRVDCHKLAPADLRFWKLEIEVVHNETA